MKVFITGGTGFIGKRVVAKLVERGDDVNVLVRSERSASIVESLGGHAVRGELSDLAVLRKNMEGCDVVFHIAGWYKLGANDPAKMEEINVVGTRNVLSTAHELGVPKIVYTSTLAVYGDTHGKVVDESFYQGAPFLNDYDRTKWMAHYEVALPLIEAGAPIVIVLPGAVYGPGDHSLISEMMGQFYQGKLPMVAGYDTALTFTHVDDIAAGHILAADKGKVGESYILAGPGLTMGELVDLWAELSSKRRPMLYIPAKLLRPFAPVVGVLESLIPLPSLYSRDSLNILGSTYLARADKAKNELGWSPRALNSGMLESMMALAQDLPKETLPDESLKKRKLLISLLLVSTLGAFSLWLLTRRRK